MAGFDIHPSVNILPTARLICWNIKVSEKTFIGEEVMITGGDIRIGANCDIAPRFNRRGAGNNKTRAFRFSKIRKYKGHILV
jgi:acetyltransferase-like isoleucine patch superfamily enzyme